MITKKTYTITLKTNEPFRIGGKIDPLSGADNPVTVVGGRVCIPGPSLKGAFRAQIERWLFDNYFDQSSNSWKYPSITPCIPATKLSRDEEELVKKKRYKEGKGCVYSSNSTICPACYLLGAPSLVGFVMVPFLFTNIPQQSLYSSRMERASLKVMEGTNRPYQLVPPNAEFKGELEVLWEDTLLQWKLGEPRPLHENPDADRWLKEGDWTGEKVLKELIIDRLESLDRLGGYRSKGFGKVSVKLTEVKRD